MQRGNGVAASAREFFGRSWAILGGWIGSTVLGLIGWLLTFSPQSWGLPSYFSSIPGLAWALFLVTSYTILSFSTFHQTRRQLLEKVEALQAAIFDGTQENQNSAHRKAVRALEALAEVESSIRNEYSAVFERKGRWALPSDQAQRVLQNGSWSQVFGRFSSAIKDLRETLERSDTAVYETYEPILTRYQATLDSIVGRRVDYRDLARTADWLKNMLVDTNLHEVIARSRRQEEILRL